MSATRRRLSKGSPLIPYLAIAFFCRATSQSNTSCRSPESKKSKMKQKVGGKQKGSRAGTEKNSLVLCKLGLEQLIELYEKLYAATRPVTHGLPMEYEPYFCVKSDIIPFNAKKLSLAPITFNRWMMELGTEWDFVDYSKPWSFAPATVAMACEGVFMKTPDDQASHLCGNAWCLRASHLVVETSKLNNARRLCPGSIVCTHGECHDFCQHEPKCIKIRLP